MLQILSHPAVIREQGGTEMGRVSCTSFRTSPLGRRCWRVCVLSFSGERFCKAFAVHVRTNVTLRACLGDWANRKDTWPRNSGFLLISG